MKIKLFLLAAAAAMTTLVGCSDKDSGKGPTPEPALPEGYEITFGTATVSSQELTITPISPEAEESLYLCYVVPEEMFNDYGSVESCAMADLAAWMSDLPDATMEEIIYAMTNNGQNKGAITTTVTGLSANSNYYAMAVGINLEGEFTTQGTEVPFTSASKPDVVEVDCDFTWEVTRPGCIFLDVKVTPTNTSIPYVAFWLSQEEYRTMGGSPEGVKKNLEAYMENLAANAGYETIVDLMADLQNRGESELQIQGLEPQTEYVLFLCGMDAYGRPTTDVEVLNASTIAYVPSDAVLTPAARIYSGTTASSMNSSLFPPSTYSGNLFVRVKPLLNDKAAAWYLLPIDTDHSKDTDEELLVLISQQGTGPITQPNIDVLAPESTDQTYYIYMYPVNESGEPGNIARMSIDVSANNVSDINTIFDEDYTQGAGTSAMAVPFSSAVKMMASKAAVKSVKVSRL